MAMRGILSSYSVPRILVGDAVNDQIMESCTNLTRMRRNTLT